MPRRNFQVSTVNPYHVTARCLNKEWFAVPLPQVWQILCDYLYFVGKAYDLKFHGFVLMGNHFHLLTSTPTGSISEAMQYFMKETSRALAKESGRINHIWGSRFDRCEIRSTHHYLNAYKYIYRNPVKAGLCREVESYSFSTLHGLLGLSRLLIPLVEDKTLFSDLEGTLNWLNKSVPEAHAEAVRRALRRKVFTLPKIDSRPHELEIDLL